MVFKPLTVYGLGRQISVTAIHLNRKSPTDSAANAATDKNAQHVIRFGKVYDKKPVRMALEDGKLYSWCTCGLSKKQVSACFIRHIGVDFGGSPGTCPQ